MSAETVGRHMPPVITLDDLTAMMAADDYHRYEISPEAVLSVMPPAGTMYQLEDGRYRVRATMPLAWALNTAPSEHDLG